MLTIAHIVNPVAATEPSDLVVAQPITLETMRLARDFAASHVDVSLFAVQVADEPPVQLPTCFRQLPPLSRSVLELKAFSRPRRLPLLADILKRLADASDAELFVYTNVDIALQPHFYRTVERLYTAGHDAFVINRRTIPAIFRTPDEIPAMLAVVGEPHAGHDCFVFRRDALLRYRLGAVCVGTRLVGRVLLWNLVAHSRQFAEFKELHATLHIGEEKPWKDPAFADYDRHNHDEALSVLRALDAEHALISKLRAEHPEYLVAVDWGVLTSQRNSE